MESLAGYNNNPGNIRPKKDVAYEGLLGVDEKGFGIFETPEAGRKALVGDIRAKMSQGLNTPESLIDKYTPAGAENQEEARDNYKIWLAHKLGLKSTADPFPENSQEALADAIVAFEGGAWNKKQEPETAAAPAPSPYGAEVKTAAQAEPQAPESDKGKAGAVAGAIGSGLGSVYTAKAPVVRLAQRIGLLPGGRPISPQDAAALAAATMGQQAATAEAAAGAAQTPGARGAMPTGGAYPRAVGPNQAVINYALANGLTLIEAERALDMTKQAGGVHDLLTKRREATLGLRERFPMETWRENPTYSGILTQESGVGGGPRASYVMKGPTPSAPGQPAQPGGLQQLPPRSSIPIGTTPVVPPPREPGSLSLFGKAMTSAPVRGGLAGFGFGSNLQEAYERAQEKDASGAAVSGAGALGSLLSVLPTRVSPAGAVMAAAPDVYTRAKGKDYLGAGISGGTATAAALAPFLMSGPPGWALAASLGLSGPVINAIRDYSKKLSSEESRKEPKGAMPAMDVMGNPMP